MNKRMRELMEQIQQKHKEAQSYMVEGEGRDLAKAEKLFDEADELQKEFDLEARKEKAGKAAAAAAEGGIPGGTSDDANKKADGFQAMTKKLNGQTMSEVEKAMISGDNAENGENYLIPEDVRLEINELRKTYVSAKSIVNVETTDALTGSVNYENGAPAGLTDFEDGAEIAASDEPDFARKPFKIKHKGKLIPISRILLGAEKAGLLGYINRWFLRSAVVSENAAIFDALKTGYNGGTPKSITGWKALKKSINVDLDPSCKLQGMIVTNQSGFACLDEEEDANGRPILQTNPAHPTEKLFQGLPVHVFPDAQLPNIDSTHFPVFYGDTKAGATFVERNALEFATSEHYGFNKNQNYMRVIEGFDVMSTDTGAYIYGSFTATAKA
jgi:HK97 family phage major capsid protein